MAAEVSDLNIIQDEDTLRKMWQQTEDFSRKKEIRLRMYRLREERLKSYYVTSKETSSDGGAITKRKPDTSSHAESLSDHGFLTMKAKEIRDSASPTLEFKQSNLCESSHADQSAADHTSQTRQTVQQTFSSRTLDSGHQKDDGRISTSSVACESNTATTVPYVGNGATLVAYDANNKLRQNVEKSSSSSYSLTSERYATSSKRETTTETTHRVSNAERGNDGAIRMITDRNSSNDHVDYRIDGADKNALNHVDRSGDTGLSQRHESRLTKAGTGERITSSRQSVYEENFSQPSHHEMTTSLTEFENTSANDNRQTNHESRNSLVRSTEFKTTSSTDSHNNVDQNIINELHKLDSYLSTETARPVPASPSSYTSEKRVDSSTTEVHEQTQNSYSKISVDVSATHAAFASSLRASPDRSTTSPGKRSTSRSSLERSSPEKTTRGSPEKSTRSSPEKSTRGSPEKSSTNDLSKKFTASFQNRISTTSRRESKSTNSVPRRKTASLSSEDDSDDSSATYDKRCNSVVKSSNQSNTYTNNTINRIQQKPQISRNSPTKSSGNTSEGSVEREIYRPYAKSPDSSPERSAFRPVGRTDVHSTQSVERLKTETRRQSLPQTPTTTDRMITKKTRGDETVSVARRPSPEKLSKTNHPQDVTSYPTSTNHTTALKSHEKVSPNPSEPSLKQVPAISPPIGTIPKSKPQMSHAPKSPSSTERTSKTITSAESSKKAEVPAKSTAPKTNEKVTKRPVKIENIVDVDEKDAVEEIHVDVIPKSKPSEKVTDASVKDKKSSSKAPIKKKRSATCGEFSNICNQKSSSTVRDDSTSESESSSEDSDSEDEREEVIIEEIVDGEVTQTKKKPVPDELDKSIKTNEEVEKEKLTRKSVPLIPEDKTTLDKKGRAEEFIRQEKIIKEGELDGCLPEIEDVLGKDADKAAVDDFIRWEQEAEKKTRAVSEKELSPRRPVEKEPVKGADVQLKSTLQTPSKVAKKNDRQLPRKSVRTDSVELRKRESKGNDAAQKTLTKSSSRTSITPKETKEVKKPNTDKVSRAVTKQASTKSVTPTIEKVTPTTKVRTDSSTRLTKQASDRSLKEKNEKSKLKKKLDLDHKTKSETAIQQTKRINAYQRRATDQVKPKSIGKTDSRTFDKENREIRQRTDSRKRLSDTIAKSSPQKPNPNTTRSNTTSVSEVQNARFTTARPQKRIPSSARDRNIDTKVSNAPTKSAVDRTKSQTAQKTTKNTREPTAKTVGPQKPKSAVITIPTINTKQPKSKERKSSISASSTSSTSQSDLNEHDTDERVTCESKTEIRKTQTVTTTETREPHLNVVVRLPSSSRETTPNKPAEDSYCTVTDDEGVPRYADKVMMPEDTEVNKRTVTNLRFEKITDLDEEADIDTVNISVAERMNKFLENAKDTSTKQTVVEDDLFQNREQAVSKTKEIFESIAKSQAPSNPRPPPLINRPSIFEQKRIRETVEEVDEKEETCRTTSDQSKDTNQTVEIVHDSPHKVVSRKLTDKDYNEYVKEKSERDVRAAETAEENVREERHVTRIAQNFETRTGSETTKVDAKTKSVPEKPADRESSPTKATKLKSKGDVLVGQVLPGPRQPLLTNVVTTKISLTSLNTESDARTSTRSPTKGVDSNYQPQYSRDSSPVKEQQNRTSVQGTAKSVQKISLAELHSDSERNTKHTASASSSRHSSPSKDTGYSRRTASSTYKEREKSTSPVKEMHTAHGSSSTTPERKKSRSSPPRTSSPTKSDGHLTSQRSRQNSPTKDSRTTSTSSRHSPTKETKKRPISPPSRKSSPAKEAKTPVKRISPVKETNDSKKRPTPPTSRRTSPTKETKKPVDGRPTSPTKEARSTKRPTSRHTNTIQSTIQRYENNSRSPPRKLRPIEIVQVEVTPSKQVYEHTAVTNVHAYPGRHAPIVETFNQTLTRTADEGLQSVATKQTESFKRKTEKSPSPEKRPRKSPSPSKETKRTSSTYETKTISHKRQKSPSPERKAAKLKNKFQTTVEGETKKKPFEKRISTTGHDYHNRKQFFETKSRQNSRGGNDGEDKSLTTAATTVVTRKSPDRRVGQKSEIRKISHEATTATTTTTARSYSSKTFLENNVREFQGPQASETKRKSPERGSDGKRKSPDKTTTTTKKSTPFGVTLRKTSPSTTAAATANSANVFSSVQKTTATVEDDDNGKRIEEIFDLEVLEKMLERAVQYDIRSRIRAQIRLVKRQLELTKTSRTPSPHKSPTRDTKKSSLNQVSQLTNSRTENQTSSVDRRDKAKRRLFADEKTSAKAETKTHTTGTKIDHCEKSSRHDSSVKISATNGFNLRNVAADDDRSTYETDYGSRVIAAATNNAAETKSTTESIISSYGVGPTDENGRPLFGLKALRTSSETKFTDEGNVADTLSRMVCGPEDRVALQRRVAYARAAANTNDAIESSYLDERARTSTEYVADVTDHAGRPLFGIRALQRKSVEDEPDAPSPLTSLSRYDSNTNDSKTYRTMSSESSSRMYSSRTAMKSDSSGNVSIQRAEMKGELFSKDGKEPTGKMTTTRYSYHKPEGGEATVKTKTTTSVLNAKDSTTDIFANHDRQRPSTLTNETESWKSKLGSSSLIRKISNEHFEKAQRKFSGEDVTTLSNGEPRLGSYETQTESRRKIYGTVDAAAATDKFSSRDESVDECSAHRLYDFDRNSLSYEPETRSSTAGIGRHDSFKDIKNKFQQATVSSSLKQVTKSPDGRTSPAKLRSERQSTDESSTTARSNAANHESVTSSSHRYESRSYKTESSSSSDIQDLLNRIKNNGFHSRSENADEDKEAVSPLSKYTSSSVSLRELDRVPKCGDPEEPISSKAAALVRQVEKQQSKTQRSDEDEINVDQIWDENQLRNLLELCTDYESRRLIRARLRAIMAENKASADANGNAENADQTQTNDTSQTTTVTSSKSETVSSSYTKVQNKTPTSGRMIKANSVTSPFTKFRQIDRQNSLPSSGAPIFKYTDPKLTRSATSIKDRLLNWVKAQTKDYKNVQIDNFSTSWNNGLAFCALIHHFCPYAFDYNQLTPEKRRYNFELAFKVAEEEAGIVPLLDVEDMMVMVRPDWKCVFTYVQSFYQRFHATPEAIRPQQSLSSLTNCD